jgi:3-hydroxyisobutyrate dehydrogenase-like beta-hydroxyacid dehydrogenase
MEMPAGTPAAGLVGLGIIGTRIAACLRRAGWQVWLWNRSLRPEPNFLGSPAEVAEATKHIQLFVSNGEALLAVVRAMAPALTPEHVIINHATVSPSETLQAAEIVQATQAAFLDAPFTGSRDAAQHGQLVYYVGGDPLALARVRQQLEISSKQILEVGALGQASALKIATNLIVANAVASFSEALALLDRHSVPLPTLSRALARHVARSDLSDMKIPSMLAADFEPRFALKHMFKDVQLALTMAEEKDIELPATAAAAGVLMAALQRGWGENDFSVISRFYDYPGRDPSPPLPTPPPIVPPPIPSRTPANLRNLWGLLPRKK